MRERDVFILTFFIVCQGAYIDDSHCTKTFGHWSPCRKFKSCYKRMPTLECILKCENEKFKKRGFNLMAKLGVKVSRKYGPRTFYKLK